MTILAERLLAPVKAADVDALLLGCTHYPYLARVICDVMGREVVLVSSADETAFEVRRLLDETGLRRSATARAAGPASLLLVRATWHGSRSSAAGSSAPSWLPPGSCTSTTPRTGHHEIGPACGRAFGPTPRRSTGHRPKS